MSAPIIFFATWLVAIGLWLGPSTAACQLPSPDSITATADSGRVPTDTVDTTGAPPSASDSAPFSSDTVRPGAEGALRPDTTPRQGSALPDSAAAADTTRVTSDTLPPRSNPDSIRADSVAQVQAPRDSILDVACSGPARPRIIAPDLLVVVFASGVTAEERAEAAGSVGGKLVGSPEPGVFYLRVPAGGDEYRLRVTADQLSLLPQVRQVGNRACPTNPPDRTG